VLPPDHPDTLASVNNLGVVLERHGKYEEAELMFRKAIEGHEQVLPDHPDIFIIVSNLGIAIQLQGRYEEAESMHRRALAAREKLLLPEHPATLPSINDLGVVLERQGKYEEAELIHQRTLAAQEKLLPPEHPATLYPAVIVEVCYSQKSHRVAHLADEYILNTDGSVNAVLAFDIDYRSSKKRRLPYSDRTM
jgi:Tfp pilus assembly protein PilF